MTPVDIGDTQGTLQAKKKRLKHSINAQRHLYESTQAQESLEDCPMSYDWDTREECPESSKSSFFKFQVTLHFSMTRSKYVTTL